MMTRFLLSSRQVDLQRKASCFGYLGLTLRRANSYFEKFRRNTIKHWELQRPFYSINLESLRKIVTNDSLRRCSHVTSGASRLHPSSRHSQERQRVSWMMSTTRTRR